MDIDNENHWGGDYFTTHFKTPGSRALRDSEGRDRSKILFVNDIDKDGSGTPDYMDGWGCPTTQIPLLEREQAGGGHRAQNTENRFVPMSVTLANIPSDSDVRIRFNYPESPPETLQRERLGVEWYPVPPVNFEVERLKLYNSTPTYKVASPAGKIRIWKKDGSSQRNAAADYVRSGQTVMTRSDLQGVNGTLYLEAVNPSADWSDIRIAVSLSVDGGSRWVSSSAVRVTAMRCNFAVGVVRPYFQTKRQGTRTEFIPDYSTPAACLRNLADAMLATEFYSGFKKYLPFVSSDLDPFWHEGGDSVLGHGFAYFQYEGPDLGNELSAKCSVSQYDKKFYWGKTGGAGLTHWHYGTNGHANDQSELAWWDICQYKLDVPSSKYLVLKKSYTLPPARASQLFETFDDLSSSPHRYKHFGLHINEAPDVKGWGCLSNAGLAMRHNGLDQTKMEQCRFNKDMPSTVNASVWAIITGKQWLIEQSKAGHDLMKNVIDLVVNETQGLSWGGVKPILGVNALQGKLFNALTGEDMVLYVPTELSGHIELQYTIQSISHISLDDNAPTHLDYYDPGRFPIVFGEHPESVFNMED